MSAQAVGHFDIDSGASPSLSASMRAGFLLMAVCVALSGRFVIGRLLRLALLVAAIVLAGEYAIEALGRI